MQIPERLGKYEIVQVIGKGAMGIVYKGFDPHIRRPVAIKTIRSDRVGGDEEQRLARFEHEAQAAGRLSHPGIVAVYEYGEEEDLVYIVMEYVEGHDLGEYFLRGNRFGMDDIVSIMVQLLDALGHAHQQGVVHRDIKPANLILTDSGRLKIADFGIAHIAASDLTHVGMIMGTPSYMAPEQFLGRPVDGRADLYATGVLLYNLLTWQLPFQGTYDEIAYQVCHVTAPLVSSVAPGRVPPSFDRVVATALAKEAADRYASAQLFKEAILAVYSAPVPETVSGETRIIGAPPREQQHYRPSPSAASSGQAGPSLSRVETPTPSAGGTPGPSQHPSGLASFGSIPPGWDPALLKEVEQRLAPLVGPVARVLIKKAAKETSDLDTLYRALAEELENPQDRVTFLASRPKAATGSTGAAPVHDSSGAGFPADAGRPLTCEEIEQAARILAPFVGPIAKVMAKRAAKRCRTVADLYLLLAEELPDAANRERFLKAAPRR